MLDCAVLIIAFNRPFHVERVIKQVSKVKPKSIYYAVDGPRKGNTSDIQKCIEVRNLVCLIDWNCKVYTLFRDENLGCKYGPITAINWFFDNEKYGIILEDDIIADESFFPFCENMLIKYENCQDILMISGRNERGTWGGRKNNYFFTLGGCWGWATWRRAWQLFDPELKNWTEDIRQKLKADYEYISKAMYSELQYGCDAVKFNNLDAWDYQWLFTKMYYKTKDIMPSKNLTRNIGFDEYGTHTKYVETDALKVFPIYPPYIESENGTIDYKYINAAYKSQEKSLLDKFKTSIKNIIPIRWKSVIKRLAS